MYVEKDFPLEKREALQKIGYRVQQRSSIGRTEVIKVIYEKNQSGKIRRIKIEAVADNRGDDTADGF